MNYEFETAGSNSQPSLYSTTLHRRDHVELILFCIHSPDYLLTAGKNIHEATM